MSNSLPRALRWSWLEKLSGRLDTRYELTLVVFFASFSALGILPFVVYRFASGAMLAGVLDLLLVVGMASVATYALRTGRTVGPGRVLCAINTVGAMASSTLLGEVGLFWMYAVQMTNFFLVERRVAALVSLGSIAFLCLHGAAFDSTAEMLSFLVTSLLVALLSLVLSSRTDSQRRQLERLATLDALTGSHNRRAMETELAIASDLRGRGANPPGLLLFDIDHFKRVNDEFGHEAGDKVLMAVVAEARAGTRSVDRVFRMGGEEFVLLLPNTDGEALRIAAEHLRERIERTVSSGGRPLTISVGCASLRNAETWAEWLGRADAALYRAKQSGRNRVEVA